MKDPYAQDKAELIAGKLFVNPDLSLSKAVPFDEPGRLDQVLATVRQLQHLCDFPEKDYQVKYHAGPSRSVLRLSDYFTRHSSEAGQFFWMFGDVIMGGDFNDYTDCTRIAEFASGIRDDVREDEVSSQAFAIVTALRRLRAGR